MKIQTGAISGRRVLYVVDNTESAQFRYRVENIARVLDGSKWKVEWALRSELESIDVDRYDLVVVMRQTDKDGLVGQFIGLVHKASKRVLFDLDDLIFDYRDLVMLMCATNSKNLAYWLGYFWGIRRIAKRADGFICTNDFLAGKLERSFKRPVRVVRNSLNKEQVAVSNKLIKEKTERAKKGADFLIGYFSGSPTHAKDFALVEPELLKFLEVYSDARLRVVGYMKFSPKMQKMINEDRVETCGVVDYLELQNLMAEVDVNIAPLVINDFTNCKSELKFFEAAAVETTTIASPTYAFKKAIKDGENGFLAKPGEWYDKLEYLYRNPEENRKIAKKARKYALQHYYGKEFLKEVEDAYDYFAK